MKNNIFSGFAGDYTDTTDDETVGVSEVVNSLLK